MTAFLTVAQIKAIYDCPEYRAHKWLAPLNYALLKWGIDTPERIAMFLAQIGHESGRLVYVKELWGPTEAQSRYEGRLDLGNTEPGDGFRYRGRGLIQITGRANYERAQDALKLPLLEHPELLEQPEHAADSAGWFWATHGCNELADRNEFRGVTRRINGGLNGYNDRLALWQKTEQTLKGLS